MTTTLNAGAERHPDLLLDTAAELSVRADGYAVVDLLDATEIAAFRRLYEEHAPDEKGGFRPSYAVWEPERKRASFDAVMPLWKAVLDRLCVERQAFMTSYLPKYPGEGSELPLHQDWSYVDETEHRSMVVWVALDDVGLELDNGPLYVLPGSHLVGLERRGTLTAPWYGGFEDEIHQHSVPVEVRAGQGVVMDNRLLHFSPPNRSDSMRLAVAVAITSRDAQLIHATSKGDGRVWIHHVDVDFFLERAPEDLKRDSLDPAAAVTEGPMVVAPPDARTLADRWSIHITSEPGVTAPTQHGAASNAQAAPAQRTTGADTADLRREDGGPTMPLRRWLGRVVRRQNEVRT